MELVPDGFAVCGWDVPDAIGNGRAVCLGFAVRYVGDVKWLL